MTTAILTPLRELHSRTADGILVRMLWREDDNRIFVAVDDEKTGETFSVEVPDGERAMQVFAHPFAYATAAR
jgi:hypothetical protein